MLKEKLPPVLFGFIPDIESTFVCNLAWTVIKCGDNLWETTTEGYFKINYFPFIVVFVDGVLPKLLKYISLEFS